MTAYIHETAVVDEGAVIGANTRIWHFCHVMPRATIGDECSLGQNVFVANGVTIGDRVKIQNNVSVYEGVIVEDDVFLGPSMVFTNVRTPRAAFPRRGAEHYATTRVCRGASIGANATVVAGVTLGPFSFVGAGAVVTHDVPAHALVVGVPGRVVGWVCACGERLQMEEPHGRCEACGRTYRRGAGGLEEEPK